MKKVLGWLLVVVLAVLAVYWLSRFWVGPSALGYSLRELLNSGQDQKCFFSEETDTASSESTVYTTTGKLRSYFVSTTTAQTISAHMLLNNDNVYTWLDGFDLGLKTSLKTEPTNSIQKGLDLDQKLDYQCEPWTFASPAVKEATFGLPTTIKFTEIK